MSLKLKDMSFLLSITGNPSFKPSTLVCTLVQWKNQGFHTVEDLYLDGTFSCFKQKFENFWKEIFKLFSESHRPLLKQDPTD